MNQALSFRSRAQTRSTDQLLFVLRRTALVVFLVAMYLNLGINLGGTYVGGLLASIVGLFLLALHLLSSSSKKVRFSTLIIAFATGSWALTIPFSPNPSGFWLEALKSLAVLMTSVLAAFGACVELRTFSRKRLGTYCGFVAGTLIVLAYLEIYTPFRQISDAFRNTVFSGQFLYDADLRDLAIAGGIRPNVFTQEPSHAAKAIAVSLGGWIILSRSRYSYLIGSLAWVLAMYACRSPTLVLAIGIVTASWAYLRSLRHGKERPGQLIIRVLISIAPVIPFFVLPAIAGLLPFDRAQMIASGEDQSAITRTQGPMLVAYHTALEYPIAGAGIGGRELVSDIVYSVYSSFPGYYVERLTISEGYVGWGNAFFEMLTYCGIFMGLFLLPLLVAAMRQFHRDRLLIISLFFLIFNLDGGFGTMRPWGYFAVITAMVAVIDRERREQASTRVFVCEQGSSRPRL